MVMNKITRRNIINTYHCRFNNKKTVEISEMLNKTLDDYSYNEIIISINNQKFIIIHILDKNYSGLYVEKVKYSYK
jgi:hypothetical protein